MCSPEQAPRVCARAAGGRRDRRVSGGPEAERCRSCPLAGPGGTFSFLLRPEHAGLVARYSRLRSYRPGEIIVAQGEAVEGWHVLRAGTARLFMSDDEGREQTVRFAQPGDLIGGCGGPVLGYPHASCYSAAALGNPTEVCFFPARSLARVFEECPTLAEAFLGLMVNHLSDTYRRLAALRTTRARDRLVDALLRLADASSPTLGAPEVTLKLARQQLADVLGVTKETAVRALAALKRRGLLETKGQTIVIRDREALRSLRRGR